MHKAFQRSQCLACIRRDAGPSLATTFWYDACLRHRRWFEDSLDVPSNGYSWCAEVQQNWIEVVLNNRAHHEEIVDLPTPRIVPPNCSIHFTILGETKYGWWRWWSTCWRFSVVDAGHDPSELCSLQNRNGFLQVIFFSCREVCKKLLSQWVVANCSLYNGWRFWILLHMNNRCVRYLHKTLTCDYGQWSMSRFHGIRSLIKEFQKVVDDCRVSWCIYGGSLVFTELTCFWVQLG